MKQIAVGTFSLLILIATLSLLHGPDAAYAKGKRQNDLETRVSDLEKKVAKLEEAIAKLQPKPNTNKTVITYQGRATSLIALYRAFQDNPGYASQRYNGTSGVFKGTVHAVLKLDDGTACTNIVVGARGNAVIATFSSFDEISDLHAGDEFTFKGTIEKYKYDSIWIQNCTVVR